MFRNNNKMYIGLQTRQTLTSGNSWGLYLQKRIFMWYIAVCQQFVGFWPCVKSIFGRYLSILQRKHRGHFEREVSYTAIKHWYVGIRPGCHISMRPDRTISQKLIASNKPIKVSCDCFMMKDAIQCTDEKHFNFLALVFVHEFIFTLINNVTVQVYVFT